MMTSTGVWGLTITKAERGETFRELRDREKGN